MDNPRKDSTQSKGEKQPSRKNSTRDGKKQGKHQKGKPRKPRYEIPEGWMEECENTVTKDMKLPSLPSDKDRIQRPNFNKMKNDMAFYESKIQERFKKIDSLKEEQRKIRNAMWEKNSTLYDELKKLNEERKVHSEVLKKNKKKKEELLGKINQIDNQLKDFEKKSGSGSGRVMRKKELTDLLKQKQDEFKNTKKTSAMEKKMVEEMNKLKSQLKTIPGFEKLKVARGKKSDVIREISKQNKAEFEEIQRINSLCDAIRVKLDENTLKIKKEKEEKEKEEGGKKKKMPSKAETELEAMKQEHYDEIKKLKESKKGLWEKFDKDYYEFEKQQFEVRKVGFMQKIQKRLRREEREAKWKEEEEKFKLMEEEKVKELLQFKYAEEINLCESLLNLVDDMRPDKKKEEGKTFTVAKPTTHKVDETLLNEENLVYIKPKVKEDNVVNRKKKKRQKKNKKKAFTGDINEQKVTIHFDTLNLFNEIKVVPPSTYGQIDECVKQLNEKKEYYLELRNKEIENADKVEEKKEGEEELEEVKEEKEEKEEEKKEEEVKKVKKQPKKKAIKMNEDNFPTL